MCKSSSATTTSSDRGRDRSMRGKLIRIEMIAGRGRKRISAADRAPQPATQPAFEDATLGGDAEPVRWQFEERDVSFQKIARFLVVDQPTHDDLQGDG